MEDLLRDRLDKGILKRSSVLVDASQQVLDLLVSNPMFSGFDSNELNRIANYLSLYEAPSGGTVINEGEPGEFLCLIVEGKLSVVKHCSDEKTTKKLTLLRPGRSFGEMSLIDNLPYSASAVAEEDCLLLILTSESLEKMIEAYPKLAVKFVLQLSKLISQRLRQTTGILMDHLG